jgi:hypothetical protein
VSAEELCDRVRRASLTAGELARWLVAPGLATRTGDGRLAPTDEAVSVGSALIPIELGRRDTTEGPVSRPLRRLCRTTQELLAQRTFTRKLSTTPPSFAIVTVNPGAPVTSLTANAAVTVRSAESPAVSAVSGK